jgi:hypothetical protein
MAWDRPRSLVRRDHREPPGSSRRAEPFAGAISKQPRFRISDSRFRGTHRDGLPQLSGFNFFGGVFLSPEFAALFLGLTLYAPAFIAENRPRRNYSRWTPANSRRRTPTSGLCDFLTTIKVPLTEPALDWIRRRSLFVCGPWLTSFSVPDVALQARVLSGISHRQRDSDV